jgi:GNAT superfamily N-acetyltransferase
MSADAVRSRFPCKEDNFVLGAFDERERLVGVAGFFRIEAVKARHKGVVWGMYVAPEARGRGVGKDLLEGLIERCMRLTELEQLNLDVVIPNDAARNLYLRSGFSIIVREEEAMKHNGVYYTVEHMVLRLR